MVRELKLLRLMKRHCQIAMTLSLKVKIRAPMKRKNEVSTHNIESSNADNLCKVISSFVSANKCKKIKLKLEISD